MLLVYRLNFNVTISLYVMSFSLYIARNGPTSNKGKYRTDPVAQHLNLISTFYSQKKSDRARSDNINRSSYARFYWRTYTYTCAIHMHVMCIYMYHVLMKHTQ